ncbi:hypothetical protein D0Z67_15770 [Streptomyces seoulensis]|uniref:YD repeat-containing protein n=1 Tax=Streptomyces seoulensis TaxID=73044 RepID=A0A4P6TYG5_STRSO|nr:hypothetical protein [Streptomyces seoulensis]QBJ91601.1 hypothetical protein D0Z67_15770 [Streptomyces seoulensis]
MYSEFTVPDDEEIFDIIGAWPETQESGARALTWRSGDGALVLSYEAVTRSVRILWSNTDGDSLLDVYREGATRLAFTSTPSAVGAQIDFSVGECAGVMEIDISPRIAVRDRLLFR